MINLKSNHHSVNAIAAARAAGFTTAIDDAAEMRDRKAERARISAQKVIQWYLNPDNKPAAPRVTLQANNAKIKDTDTTAFLIFSLPAVITCPGACTGCMHSCYARRDERFPSVRTGRLSNLIMSRRADFADAVESAINTALYTKRGALRARFIGKRIIFRLHESGDFYSAAYMRAWFEIARRFPFIQFFTYTKSFSIYAECAAERPTNMVIRASIWKDATTAAECDAVESLGLPVYTVLENTDSADFACDCGGGCGGCGCACSVASLLAIIAAIH